MLVSLGFSCVVVLLLLFSRLQFADFFCIILIYLICFWLCPITILSLDRHTHMHICFHIFPLPYNCFGNLDCFDENFQVILGDWSLSVFSHIEL